MAGRHRHPVHRLGRWTVPPAGVVTAWLSEDTPGGSAGFGLVLALGLLLSLAYPLVLLLAIQAPGSLVPPSWRAWWRRGAEDRPAVPAWLRRVVLAADRHRCVACRSMVQLQLDHVRPWSVGGRMSLWNFMVLCGPCNRVKSNYWEFRSGRVAYRPWKGYGNRQGAREILLLELRHRWSLLRLIRAAMAL